MGSKNAVEVLHLAPSLIVDSVCTMQFPSYSEQSVYRKPENKESALGMVSDDRIGLITEFYTDD